ncbi:MAG TPA: hypothetical protein VMH23_14820 [Bacteroidota bacterium]|nr:hypothetical protein [Bacteroidota bacterium]
MATPAVQNAIDSVAAINGISQSYVDFTTKLVTDVMNALVASSISQMRAYADLVSQLERGLAAFKSQAATQQGTIAWMRSRVPESADQQNAAVVIVPKSLQQSSVDVIKNLYANKLASVLGAGTYGMPKTDITSLTVTPTFDPTDFGALDGSTAKDYTANQLPAAVNGVIPIDLLSAVKTMMAGDAQDAYQQLDKLVQMGMMRVVITDGHILTKMSFEMETSDSSQHSASDVYGSSFAVSASAGAGWGWGSASAKTSYSNFKVKTANDHSQTSTDIHVAMMGEVLVNYRSDYFPLLPSQAKP